MGKALTTWQQFQTELQAREHEIAAVLPEHVSPERFMACTVAAAKQNPVLPRCDPRSLFAAITRSAQDGILPDGREGVILAFGKEATWIPMTFGLRKRAYQLDKMVVSAAVVHEHDEFLWLQGDDDRIEHKPAKLGTERGRVIGAYAIFKDKEQNILHREVVSVIEIEKVRAQSKASNSLMWTKFYEEACKKTAVRRGFKTIPIGESLDQIVTRDDANYDFGGERDADGRPLPPVAGGGSTPRRRRRPAPIVVAGPANGEPPVVGAEDDGDDRLPDIDPELDRRAELWTLDTASRLHWKGHGPQDSPTAKQALYARLCIEFEKRERTPAEIKIAGEISRANTDLIGSLPEERADRIYDMIEEATNVTTGG